MGKLHELFKEPIAKLASEGKIGGHAIEEAVDQAFHEALPKVAAQVLGRLKQTAPEMLQERRGADVGFRRRHGARWRQGFDLLEVLWAICAEAGSDFNSEERPRAIETHDVAFEALVTLHARALLVANEILWLLRGGFADGALARWRTLHELAVIALFISQSDRETAERYLLSFHIQAYRAICQYQEYAGRAGLEPFSQEEMEQARRMRDEVVARHGVSMKHEYGWASEALGRRTPAFTTSREAFAWTTGGRGTSGHHITHTPTISLLQLCSGCPRPTNHYFSLVQATPA